MDAGGRQRCWTRGVGGGAGGSQAVLAGPGGEDGGRWRRYQELERRAEALAAAQGPGRNKSCSRFFFGLGKAQQRV
jgi:hypothetical protein